MLKNIKKTPEKVKGQEFRKLAERFADDVLDAIWTMEEEK